MLRRLDVAADEVAARLQRDVLPGYSWAAWAEAMLRVARELGGRAVAVEHALAALLLEPSCRVYLRERHLQEEDIGFVAWWLAGQREQREQARAWWRREALHSFMGVGLSWTAGFTPLVDRFSRIPRGNLWDQVGPGRAPLVDQLITTLARERQSNVLLVGQPGTGRVGIIRELARRVRQGQAHPVLNGQRVVYVHVGELIGQAQTGAAQLVVVAQVLREMERAGNVIAVIDGLSSVLGSEGEQRLNLTEVLLPFFQSLAVRVVVVISAEEYQLRLRENEELVHFFEVVSVPSATPEETLQTLALVSPVIEKSSGVYIPYRTMRVVVDRTRGLLQSIPYPERAFDVIEEALVVAQQQRQRVLTVETVQQLISRKVGVPVGTASGEERTRLLNLEQIMHTRLVNQQQAVREVSRALIRARAGVRDESRPIGTFLFLGPTGVGKTEMAKTLAEAYFGHEDYLSRLDMSEFQGEAGVAALLGSATQPVGRLVSLIAARPFTVLLLDEFEKAHPTVHQLFLQVFDEGHITDARGSQVSFEHAMIIATSNAGAEFIRQTVEAGPLPADFDVTLRDYILRQGVLKPELINRFDGVVTFTPLSEAHVAEIARLLLNKLNKRLDDEHGVRVAVTDELIGYLLRVGYNAEFGARPMRRAIQNTVEYAVAQRVLRGLVRPGSEIVLSEQELVGERV